MTDYSSVEISQPRIRSDFDRGCIEALKYIPAETSGITQAILVMVVTLMLMIIGNIMFIQVYCLNTQVRKGEGILEAISLVSDIPV